MIAQYRLYELKGDEKFYQRIIGDEVTLTPARHEATLFTKRDCDIWCGDGLQAEEVSQDELMQLVGAPMLPGIM